MRDLAADKELRQLFVAFNAKPSDGIKEIKKTYQNEQALADFFVDNEEHLNPMAVGDYITGPGEEPKRVMALMAERHADAVKNKDFTLALRDFCTHFRLPGESQKVQRFVEAFAHAYVANNPEGSIRNEDAALVLAYQAIMLATDAHSQAIKKQDKMTLPQLTRSLEHTMRGMEGVDLNAELLKRFYDDFTKTPLTAKEISPCPTVTLDSTELANSTTFSKLSKQLMAGRLGKGVAVCGGVVQKVERQPLPGLFSGTQYTIEIANQGKTARLEITTPGRFSRRAAEAAIVPMTTANADLEFAAEVALSFNVGTHCRGGFKYLNDDLQAYLSSNLVGREQRV